MDDVFNNALAIAALARTRDAVSDNQLLGEVNGKLTNVLTALGVTVDSEGNVVTNGVDSRFSVLEDRTVPSLGDNYTITHRDKGVLVSTTSTITLPAHKEGYEVVVKKIDDTGINTIVTGEGSTIDGNASTMVSTQWNFIRLISDGSNWYKVG